MKKFLNGMRISSRSCATPATRQFVSLWKVPCARAAQSEAGRSIAPHAGVIRKAGFARYFVHRTGHNVGQEVHGAGANMDSLETRDTRRVIPKTCFSIEPGIYLPDFGIRSEVNVYVSDGKAEVTGPATG